MPTLFYFVIRYSVLDIGYSKNAVLQIMQPEVAYVFTRALIMITVNMSRSYNIVIPAKAGIQSRRDPISNVK